MSIRHKALMFFLAGMLAIAMAGDAFARAGSGSSFGSRGGRTYSAPAGTSTAPGAAPIQRSMTPNEGVFRPGARAASPGLFGGMFGRGLFGGLLGGFLGAGLFGLLFGQGLFGGLGGGFSFIGLIIQLGLLYLLVRLVMGFIRNRQQPAFQSGPTQSGPMAFDRGGSAGGGGGMGAASPGGSPLQVAPADYEAFEQALARIEAAYSDEDLDALRRMVTPEMASYFAEEIAGNARKGVVNRLTGTKLISGDLSEAWRETTQEYATVAMRFSIIDTMIERASGRVVSGDSTHPQEVTEVWTFTRPLGGSPAQWKLSAIQQA